jgi:hypothetical protein
MFRKVEEVFFALENDTREANVIEQYVFILGEDSE